MNVEYMLAQMLCGVDNNIQNVQFKCVTPLSVESFNANNNPYPGNTSIIAIPRDAAVDAIESMHPNDFGLLMSLYSEYNAFGVIGSVVHPECVLCWYNRDT